MTLGANLAAAGCLASLAHARRLIDADPTDPSGEIERALAGAWEVAWDSPPCDNKRPALHAVDQTMRYWNARVRFHEAERAGAELCADVYVAWHEWRCHAEGGTKP